MIEDVTITTIINAVINTPEPRALLVVSLVMALGSYTGLVLPATWFGHKVHHSESR